MTGESKVVLVTGGNRGIGLEICRQLAELKHTCIMASRDLEKGLAAANSIQAKLDVQALDVANSRQITDLASLVEEKYGKLDVLINNAGIGIGSKGAVDADMEEVKKIMETNFYGPWRITQDFIPLLKKSADGRIVNMSSGMGAHADLVGGYAGYRQSKSALNALTILCSNELTKSNIKVNAMCPGWVRTDMGGEGASRSVEEGADTAVWLSLEQEIPNGKFLRDRKVIPW